MEGIFLKGTRKKLGMGELQLQELIWTDRVYSLPVFLPIFYLFPQGIIYSILTYLINAMLHTFTNSSLLFLKNVSSYYQSFLTEANVQVEIIYLLKNSLISYALIGFIV